MIKKFKLFESKYVDNPATFDHERSIRECDDINHLEELLKHIDKDLKRKENPNNFRLSAMMNKITPEEYVEKEKYYTLRFKKIIEERLKELKK